MNCLDFRRTQLTRHGTEAPDFLAHRRACAHCAAMAARSDLLEERLGRAMKVKVPEKLADRILLKHSFATRKNRWNRRRQLYALAASVILAVGLVTGLTSRNGMPTLEDAVFSHVTAHPWHDDWGQAPVDKVTLATLLKPVGAAITGDLGTVTGASICAVREKVAAHLVLAGEKAPVAVLLMPEEQLKTRSTIGRGDAVGLFVPGRTGAVAIVGRRGEPLEKVEVRVRSALRWSL